MSNTLFDIYYRNYKTYGKWPSVVRCETNLEEHVLSEFLTQVSWSQHLNNVQKPIVKLTKLSTDNKNRLLSKVIPKKLEISSTSRINKMKYLG